MIPVTQTKVVIRNSQNEMVVRGNCWAAAIASILELPITEVPNFEVWFEWEDGLWWYLTQRFLNKKGFAIETDNRFRVFHMTSDEWHAFTKAGAHPLGDFVELKESLRHEFYFINGTSARGVQHVTIWQNGVMVHDPHPSKEGILDFAAFEFIRPLSNEEKANVNDHNNTMHIAFPCYYKLNNTAD